MTLSLLAANAALFLDIDGTLLEFKDDAETVRAPEALRGTLDSLRQSLGGALAVVSGRALPSVDRVFAPLRLAAAGDHGAEARFGAAGAVRTFASPPELAALSAVLAEVRSRLDVSSAVNPEKKAFSLAFHYRGAEAEELLLREIVRATVASHDALLTLAEGELCFDVFLKSQNKGKAIERFIAAPPFRGRVPVYVGDSGTDEEGFAAVLGAGGRAIRVGKPKATRATETLASPAELRDWLARSAKVLA
ncbi:MAG TPA: trehalose-phosphatase [Stellaceae bacterium]